jgi:hypothetical protein
MDEYRRMSVAEAIILSDTTGEIGDKNTAKNLPGYRMMIPKQHELRGLVTQPTLIWCQLRRDGI